MHGKTVQTGAHQVITPFFAFSCECSLDCSGPASEHRSLWMLFSQRSKTGATINHVVACLLLNLECGS